MADVVHVNQVLARGSRNDQGCGLLTERFVRHRKNHSVPDHGMSAKHVFDFLRRDFFSTTVNHVAQTPGQKEIAVMIEITQIAGAVPAHHRTRLCPGRRHSHSR